jgi:hypothetical protein
MVVGAAAASERQSVRLLKVMIPTNAAKLRPGDFCFIPRADGRFVPFAFLCSLENRRSYFYGGILDASVARPSIEELPTKLMVKHYALFHIKCFKENNTPVVGNVGARIGEKELAAIERRTRDFSVGATSSVWGYKTIVKYADSVNAKPIIGADA